MIFVSLAIELLLGHVTSLNVFNEGATNCDALARSLNLFESV